MFLFGLAVGVTVGFIASPVKKGISITRPLSDDEMYERINKLYDKEFSKNE